MQLNDVYLQLSLHNGLVKKRQ